MRWISNLAYKKIVRLALPICVAIVFLLTNQELSHGQPQSGGPPPKVRASPATFQQIVAEIKKVEKITSAQDFARKLQSGQIFLTPSERDLLSLFGTRHPEAFKLGVAQRRANLSAGAEAFAEQEFTKLQAVTQSQGGQWILQIIRLLQGDTSCQQGIWSDGLSPLVEIPEAREVIQDYLASQLGDFGLGRKLNVGCRQPRIVTSFEQGLATDFFLLFLKTEPDPFEALSLYRGLRSRLSDKRLRLAITMSVSIYLDTHLVPGSWER